MAHPHLDRLARVEGLQDTDRAVHLEGRGTVLALFAWFDRAAQAVRHQLLAVTNAKHRQVQIEQRGVRLGCLVAIDALWAAAHDDGLGIQFPDLVQAEGAGMDLAIHFAFTNAARDELGVLGSEIQD
jgi:hypothetical protein